MLNRKCKRNNVPEQNHSHPNNLFPRNEPKIPNHRKSSSFVFLSSFTKWFFLDSGVKTIFLWLLHSANWKTMRGPRERNFSSNPRYLRIVFININRSTAGGFTSRHRLVKIESTSLHCRHQFCLLVLAEGIPLSLSLSLDRISIT